MKRYWISWYNLENDWRSYSERCEGRNAPISSVLGYWKSGKAWLKSRSEDDIGARCCPIIVAAIDAKSTFNAMNDIKYEWPDNVMMYGSAYDEDLILFIENKPPDFVPGDRFPLSDWMVERFKTPADQKT
jgi:hypothetical protein